MVSVVATAVEEAINCGFSRAAGFGHIGTPAASRLQAMRVERMGRGDVKPGTRSRAKGP
jgi:hypothetical protein